MEFGKRKSGDNPFWPAPPFSCPRTFDMASKADVVSSKSASDIWQCWKRNSLENVQLPLSTPLYPRSKRASGSTADHFHPLHPLTKVQLRYNSTIEPRS